MNFSIIIPVYNRPEELDELLQSILSQKWEGKPEVLVVEDGSDKKSKAIVDKYDNLIDIKYCFKKNSGPGDSRNYGMERASGDYFIILDSDCLLPENYLGILDRTLRENYADAFGGPDAAHPSFTDKQQAINYSMTSVLSTGGLRGAKHEHRQFQVRSFNMGLSKKAFLMTGGFAKQRIGEDIELNFRLRDKNCSVRYVAEAFVYHKRRSSWAGFFRQTRDFGAARPILSRIHPGSGRVTYWFPSVFTLGFIGSVVLFFFDYKVPAMLFGLYFLAVSTDSYVKNKRFMAALLSMFAVFVQFFGYGTGFLRSVIRLYLQGKSTKEAFPKMFS